MMYPFPATIDGKPVLVYDIHQTDTGADCAIVHPNGCTGFAQWSRLIVTPNLLETLRAERDAAIARAEAAEKAQADLQTQLEEIEQSDLDLLDESIDELRDLRAKVRG